MLACCFLKRTMQFNSGNCILIFVCLCCSTKRCFNFCREEIKEGAEILKSKLIKYKPKIAVFNGKGKNNVHF